MGNGTVGKGRRGASRAAARPGVGLTPADAPRRLPGDVIEYARRSGVEMVDLKFTDLLGSWQHIAIPVARLSDALFRDGAGFDGSSMRGWRGGREADLLVIPDPDTAFLDPFAAARTLSMVCDVVDPLKRQYYARDPRHVARQAENHLKKSGVAERAAFGPELEFFLLDSVRFEQNARCGYYFVDSAEGIRDSGREERGLGDRPRHAEGALPTPPKDSLDGLRAEMVLELQHAGIDVEKAHHVAATAGQAGIDMRFDTLTRMADRVMIYKYVARNVARRHGKTATFMPKPIFGDHGSGMHTHQSLWRNSTPLFSGKEYAGVSRLCLNYIGGLLKHGPALAAFTNPTTNSYKRLAPGSEPGFALTYARGDREAGVRIPMTSEAPASRRVELRFPDPSCNPYLAFAAMLMAGLDGVEERLDPGKELDARAGRLGPEEVAGLRRLPGSLSEALDALEVDHEFLTRGQVFTEDLIAAWIDHKREREVGALRARPHPYEFCLYYDA